VIERENIKKGENMSFIDLDSVGSTVTSEGLVFPIDCSEAPETASEAEEMMGVNVFETTDEWLWNLSLVDGWTLLEFTDEHIGWVEGEENQLLGSYEEWKEKVEGLIGSYDTFVGVA